MKTILLIIAGFILIMLGLWGGGWLLLQFPVGSGYSFSAMMTSLMVSGGGVALIGYATYPKNW